MDTKPHWMKRLAKLHPYNAKHGTAPHKPLLLLVVMDLAESGELSKEVLELTPRLAFKFSTYASVVAHRRTQPVIVQYPFYHLSTNGFWTALDGQMNHTKEPERARFAMFQRD